MTLEEAYKTLGIQNHYVSSDDLREYYEIKLSQVHGFNKEKQVQKIKLAHQMIRNYRCSNDWVGSRKYSSPNEISISDVSKRKSILNVVIREVIYMLKAVCRIVVALFIIGCLRNFLEMFI